MNKRFTCFGDMNVGMALGMGVLIVSSTCVGTAQNQRAETPELPAATAVEELPISSELPDPLRFTNGRRVEKATQWPERRAEMLETMLFYEYGHVPDAPIESPMAREMESELAIDEASMAHKFKLRFGPKQELSTMLRLYTPRDGKTTHPVIVRFGLGAEHARAANDRGYVFACFDQNTLDPDTEGHDVVGPAQALYPDSDWASLAVWAWGASRVLDFLDARADIDITRSVITGHSRAGKAALLAGALDTRFKIVVPNGSGAGGSSIFRHAGNGVETLELITRDSRFKSWFHKDFGRFGDRVDQLPFDQHFMRALIAPRVVLSTDAHGDTWANPRGAQTAWRGAQPVFDLLGIPNHNLIHFREGGHDQLSSDFEVLLDVADAYFNGRPFLEKLRAPPFPGKENTSPEKNRFGVGNSG